MSPATGGPTVRGMEQMPRRKPMAWPAPAVPQMSKAMGPSIVMKQPSKMPSMRQAAIRVM